MFDQLTSEQVTGVHKVYHLLRKLGVMGIMNTSTERVNITESGKPIRYRLRFSSYDPSTKGHLSLIEKYSLSSDFFQSYRLTD